MPVVSDLFVKNMGMDGNKIIMGIVMMTIIRI